MEKPEYKNKMQKSHWNFKIQTDPQILVRRLDLVLTMKKEFLQTTEWK